MCGKRRLHCSNYDQGEYQQFDQVFGLSMQPSKLRERLNNERY